MVLFVEYCLIEVGDAPSQRDVEVEQFRELGGSFRCVGVSPCAERGKYLLLLVECHVSVHHGANADGSQLFYLNVVFGYHVGTKVSVAVLHTVPYSLDAVSPQSVDKLVLPFVRALGYRDVVLVDEHCLDSCGTEFDTENSLAFLYCSFRIVCHYLIIYISVNVLVCCNSMDQLSPIGH